MKTAASTVGNGIKSAAKTVGTGVTKAASGIWNFGKKIIGKIPSLLAKIPKFFGKK